MLLAYNINYYLIKFANYLKLGMSSSLLSKICVFFYFYFYSYSFSLLIFSLLTPLGLFAFNNFIILYPVLVASNVIGSITYYMFIILIFNSTFILFLNYFIFDPDITTISPILLAKPSISYSLITFLPISFSCIPSFLKNSLFKTP